MNKPQIRIYKRNFKTTIIKNIPEQWLKVNIALKTCLEINIIKMIYL